MPIFGFPFFNEFQLFSLAGLVVLATAVVHVVFALGVKADAQMLTLAGGRVWFAPAWAWALAVLVGGLPFLLVYWLFHHAFPRPTP